MTGKLTDFERDNLKAYLLEYIESITERDTKEKNKYVCPLCKSGRGKNHSGAFTYYDATKRWQCFSCGESGDIFDLVGAVEGIQTLPEQAEWIRKRLSIGSGAPAPLKARKTDKPETDNATRIDFTEVLERCHAELIKGNNEAYNKVKARGLSDETIKRFKIGCSPAGLNALLKGETSSHKISESRSNAYKIILPFFNDSGRATYFQAELSDRELMEKGYSKYMLIKDYDKEIYNAHYLKAGASDTIYICEGIYDALSIEELGSKAIAFLGGGTSKLANEIEKSKTAAYFVIMADNDKAGGKYAQDLKAELDKIGARCEVCFPPDETIKDCNEWLIKDRQGLKSFLEAKNNDLSKETNNNNENYLNSLNIAYMGKFKLSSLNENKATPIPTGFNNIDSLLDGGLYPGLYSIGAISSLGKTTLVLQICDNIAAAGYDVMFFSLEMDRDELIGKSISRNTAKASHDICGSYLKAKTFREITLCKINQNDGLEVKIYNEALERYSEAARKITVVEGFGKVTTQMIREMVNKQIGATGRAPVVIVDYMQIIQPLEERITDKQNTDRNVVELKRLSRDLKTPVIGISSFNRESYTKSVSMGSFKESGGIEYTADVLIGLQYEGMGNKKESEIEDLHRRNNELAAEGESFEIEVKILKNRNGAKGKGKLWFCPKYNLFTEGKLVPTGVKY